MSAGLALGLSLVPLTAIAQTSEFEGEELYILCSSFPYNSRCEGYTAPVALDERQGEDGQCVLGIAEAERGGRCKVVFREAGLTAFVEQGEPLQVLDGRPTRREVSVDYSQI